MSLHWPWRDFRIIAKIVSINRLDDNARFEIKLQIEDTHGDGLEGELFLRMPVHKESAYKVGKIYAANFRDIT